MRIIKKTQRKTYGLETVVHRVTSLIQILECLIGNGLQKKLESVVVMWQWQRKKAV